MKNDNFFWPSFSDLMTALFFVMLVLYILTFVKLKHDQEQYRVEAEKFQKLQEIEEVLSSLDKDLFVFDTQNKRYRLKTDSKFKGGSCDISDLSSEELIHLLAAGQNIYELLYSLGEKEEGVNYLLVLEGNTARKGNNFTKIPNVGYTLSYCRAMSLYNYWKKNGYDFRELDNCELMIAGSGYFGKSRDNINEANNKRFTIQITAKIGEFK